MDSPVNANEHRPRIAARHEGEAITAITATSPAPARARPASGHPPASPRLPGLRTTAGRNRAVPKVVVIGSGVGGLSAAVELSAAGADVTVLERAPHPGGKLRSVDVDGRALDAGPTVFTMRWVFDSLFEAAGERLDAHLTLAPLTTLARHAWDDGPALDLHADLDRSCDAIAAFAGSAEMRGYRTFCTRAERIFRTLETTYLRASRPGPATLSRRVGLSRLGDLLALAPFTTLSRALSHHFRDPRLIQLFGRYATYCGSSPYRAPATLMLIAHVERSGVWRVAGGMHRLATVLASLATARGARIRYDTDVAEILTAGGRARGVRLSDGEIVEADAVVHNGDAAALSGGLLGTAVSAATGRVDRHCRSQSAITWNLLASTRGRPLLHHNVFFSGDYAAEFDDVFGRRRPPADPTVYVCAQDRGDCDAPAAGPERLLCLINAPATGDTDPITPLELAQCEQLTFRQLARCGLSIDRNSGRTIVTTATDFARMFPGSGGALYGQSTHGWMASFRRPGARCRRPGLYLVGGSVHPGAGVPMAALSARQAVASLLEDHGSTTRSFPAAMPGGTSMR